MFVFQWNALRVGENVAVHDDLDPELALHEGVVELVQTRQHANEVSIRLDDRRSDIRQPRRQAVHLLPMDPRFPCWRCDEIARDRAGAHHGAGA